MSVYRILEEEIKYAEPLFKNWDETLIWSCLQGCMGTAWTDCRDKFKSVQIVIADFCFFAGKANEKEADRKSLVATPIAWRHDLPALQAAYIRILVGFSTCPVR